VFQNAKEAGQKGGLHALAQALLIYNSKVHPISMADVYQEKGSRLNDNKGNTHSALL
jgi:hypothetical protein